MAKRELKTFDEFRKARLDDTGFIVIAGSARTAVVHKLNGRCVSADNFKAKMMSDGNVAGRYYWVDSVSSAALELGASSCRICKPHLPEKVTRRT